MLDQKSVCESCGDLIVEHLFKFLIIEECIQEVKRFRLPGRFGVLGLLERWRLSPFRKLLYGFEVLLLLLLSCGELLSSRLRRIDFNCLLRVPLLLNTFNEYLGIIFKIEPEVGVPYLLVRY